MYQKVSIASCCKPFDWLPALIAQMLNQPEFLIVPSGFSTISVSLRGRSEIVPCARACPKRHAAIASAATARQKRIVSSVYGWRDATALARGRLARHVGVHHLRGVDDAVEFSLADIAELQRGLLQGQ